MEIRLSTPIRLNFATNHTKLKLSKILLIQKLWDRTWYYRKALGRTIIVLNGFALAVR